jgi:hypothetical protein
MRPKSKSRTAGGGMFCRSDEEHGREMERQMETYGWCKAQRKWK